MEEKLVSVSCDPECGFKVQSHDKAEVVRVVKDHALMAHDKRVSDEEVESMMKTEMA